jgi:hypothetical protein
MDGYGWDDCGAQQEFVKAIQKRLQAEVAGEQVWSSMAIR